MSNNCYAFFNRFLVPACLIFFTWQATGQTQYINFRHYSLEDGLSSYKVVRVLQDRFGFIWIATQDGLNRFDGKDIIIYNKSAREKYLLPGGDITDILEDTTRNILWVTSSYGGLSGIDTKTGTVRLTESVADPSHHFSDKWLKTLIQTKDELWIGTYNGITVYNIAERKIKKLLSAPWPKKYLASDQYDINLFYKDEFERVWAFSNYGITIYASSDYSILSNRSLADLGLPDEYNFKRFSNYVNLRLGQILLSTHKGIKRINYDKTGLIAISDEAMPAVGNKEILSMNLDKSGDLWFATETGLYKKRLREGLIYSVEDVNQRDGKKWTNSVNTIFFDRHSHLWLGTLQGFAIAKGIQSPFMHYFQSADLKTKLSRVNFIYPYNDSVEFVCAYNGFYKVDNSVNNIQRLKEENFWFLFRHNDGNLILSSNHNRIYVFSLPGQFSGIEKTYPELSAISHETINSAAFWNDSLLFLGSERFKGVYEWNFKKRKLVKLDSKSSVPLKDSVVNAIYKDAKNRIWILSDRSFAVYNPQSNKLDNHELSNPVTGQPLTLFFDVCEANGYYWLASYGSGLIQLDSQLIMRKVISTNNGLNNAGLYKVFPINDTFLFTTSNNGLSRINLNNYTVSNFFESDGLHSSAFEEGCGTMYNGKIYAGGPDGFTIVDPEFISSNVIPPALYISKVDMKTQIGGQEISDLQMTSITFPRNLLQATVYFSAINYSNPERTTYAYRIKGEQNEWVKIGTQDFVNLIGLKPGGYTLQVQAFTEDGLASEVKEVQLVFLPKWYQTNWFKVLLVLLVAGIVYALYKIRINQLKKEREIRTHLASDLHDDLGSTLNSVKVYANMALLEKENNSYLEKVKESTQEAINGVRDIIWVLDDKKDLLDHLLTRIKSFAAPLCGAHQINFHQQLNDSLLNYKLGKEEKRNLYMIIKEAVNNSVKYAKGKSIYLTIEHTQNKLTIKVADDGIGFEKDKITEGNGLNNMMNRAIEIEYKATIISQPGQGTTIQLEKH